MCLKGSKFTADGDYSHDIKIHLLLGRKAITNLDGILQSRDINLPTKVQVVKAIIFLGNISCKDGLNKGQKWYVPNRSRRYKEEVARIHRRTMQKNILD